jgi:hypothetical protein
MFPVGADWRSTVLAVALSVAALAAIALLTRLATKLQHPAPR